MKFSTAFTSLVAVIPLLSGQALAAAAAAQGNNGKGQGANKGAAQNNGNNSTGANNNNAADNNPQTSLTLVNSVIATGFEQNGQANATAGQVASLTSSNNFINFCATVPNLPITNGQQIKTGSCNPAPMGIIAATTDMPSAKFVSPANGDDVAANTTFNITMAINNLETGHFTNADTTYYAAPQQVNAQGQIIGHSHITVQAIPSFTTTTPLDPNTFAFFKGLNNPAVNGQLSAEVTGGLPQGFYRVCSINTDANHAPCLVAVAQHGSLDDCIYMSVGENNGKNAFSGSGSSAAAGAAGNASNSTANGANGKNAAAGNASNSTANANNGANSKTGANGQNAAAGKTGANGQNAAAGNQGNKQQLAQGGNAKNAGTANKQGSNANNAAKGGVVNKQGSTQQPGKKQGSGGRRRSLARLARDH